MTLPDVTPSEFATILAGLSALQTRVIRYPTGDDFGSIDIERAFPEHFTDVDALGADEIDALCERLNTERVPASVVITPKKRERAWRAFLAHEGWWAAFNAALDSLYDPVDDTS